MKNPSGGDPNDAPFFNHFLDPFGVPFADDLASIWPPKLAKHGAKLGSKSIFQVARRLFEHP